MTRTRISSAMLMTVLLLAGSRTTRADQEYDFILVDAFTTNYALRECYIYDLNDDNVACGTATIQNQSATTYTGFYWMPPDDKVPVGLSWPKAINNNGLMGGVTQVYDIPSNQFTNMPLLPSTYLPLALLGANDSGVVVGYVQICNCSNSQGTLQIPYVWDAEQGAHSLAVPGATGAAKVNNNGLVVGWFGGGSTPNSYVYDLNTSGYTVMSSVFPGPNVQTTAVDINDNNVVVGSRKNSNGSITYGYTWSEDAGVTLLPLPPSGFQPAVRPSSINDAGVIVGSIYTTLASSRAFVYDEAHGIRDLNTLTTPSPGFVMMTATVVNNNGWIAGYGAGGGGMYKSFVLKPVVIGDLNGDSVVGAEDLAMLLGAWGPCDGCMADIDGDNMVGSSDLAMLLGNWQ